MGLLGMLGTKYKSNQSGTRARIRPMGSMAVGTECMEAGHTPPGCKNPSPWEERCSFCGDSWDVGAKLMGRSVVSEGLTVQASLFHVELICSVKGCIVLHGYPLLSPTTWKPTCRKENALISSLY